MYVVHAHPHYDDRTKIADHEMLVQSIVERRPDAPNVMRRHLRQAVEQILAELDVPAVA
jgi:DNA-binding GntR family transcriptional regulator